MENMRHLEQIAVYRKVPEGYVGFNTQRRMLEEARANLRKAAQLVLEASRDLARQDLDQGNVPREPLRIAAE